MRSFNALFKKEVIEHIRNFKWFATLLVFMIIGVISPAFALLTPKIIEHTLKDEFEDIKIPDPTAYDSFAQFFSNMNQIGMIVFIIVFGSILTRELSEGTLINFLTKGLNRRTVILSKFSFLLFIWTVLYFLSATITYFYTVYYFEETLHHVVLSVTLAYLFGVFLISLVMLYSVITKNFVGVLLMIVVTIAVMFMIAVFKDSAPYLPVSLISQNLELLSGKLELKETVRPIIVTVSLSFFAVALAILMFNKREIV